MSFSINTNINAMTANLNSNLKNNALNHSLGSLSSGSQLGNAAYDASGLGIANQLSARVSGLGQAIMNSNDSIGMIQVADGAMQGINDNMDRIRVLTLQASNDTMDADSRAAIQKEIDGLLESSDDIAKQTSYNGIKLLDGTGGDGTGKFATQSGADAGDSQSVTFAKSDVASLVGSIDVTTQAGRDVATDTVDAALNSISDSRATLGASQNQLMSNIRNISVGQVNAAASESQIRDVDFAAESANFSHANLMSQIGSFTQAQANASASSNMSRLLG
jgi:flagellin